MLLLVGCLAVTIGAYRDRQGMARLEGNRLYSSAAVAAAVSPQQARSLVQELGGENRAFVDLDDAGSVRGVVVGDPAAFRFPTGDGTSFTAAGQPQAVVGALVETRDVDGATVIDAAGAAVPVVGQVGSGQDSLLAYDVVVMDDELFSTTQVAVVTFDGPDAAAAARSAFGDAVLPVRAGAADRTNVDVMSPVIVRLGVGGLALSAVLSGLVVGSSLRRWLDVSFVLGRTRPQLLGAASTQLVVVAAPAALLAAGAGVAVALPGGPLLPGWWSLLFAFATTFVAMHVAVWRSRPWR